MLKYYIKIFTQHIYWFDSFIFKKEKSFIK